MIEILASGLTIGVIYALIAVAVVITFNVTGLYNFALGGIAVIAGLTTAGLLSTGVPLVVAFLIAIGVSAVIAGATAAVVIPASRTLEPLSLLLLTVGVGLVLEGAGVLIWGPNGVRYPPFIAGNWELPVGRIPYYTIALAVLAAALAVAMLVFFKKSSIGRIIRANVLDSRTVRLMGARPDRLALGAFLVSGIVAGVVGFLITPVLGVSYADGLNLSVIGVVVAIIAGTYSPSGAVVVGVGLGMIESLAAGYLPSGSSSITAYFILLAVLLLRPEGLFGSPTAKRV